MGERLKGFWSRRVQRAQASADRRIAERRAAVDPTAISYDEAARLLGRSEVRGLLTRQILEPAVMASGFDGVTKESVDRELEWQRTAPRWRRWWRSTSHVLDRVWCAVLWTDL